MAAVTKTIGTSSRDYSTIAAWEADLDDIGQYSSGDDAVGELYNDSAFDEAAVTINGGSTVGLNSITLRAASGEEHDGTAGSGSRMVRSVGAFGAAWLILSSSVPITVERWEMDLNGTRNGGISVNSGHTVKQMMIHGGNGAALANGIGFSGFGNNTVISNILYDFVRTGSGQSHGIALAGSSTGGAVIIGNTVDNVDGNGISNFANNTVYVVRNNVVTRSGLSDYVNVSSATTQTNASSDGTAGGAIATDPVVASVEFISTISGSEDYTLASGAECIDAGTDLGTTPTGVNFDASGRDRDAEGDTWDVGALEHVAAGGGGTTVDASTGTLTVTGHQATVAVTTNVVATVSATGSSGRSANVSANHVVPGAAGRSRWDGLSANIDQSVLLQGLPAAVFVRGRIASIALASSVSASGAATRWAGQRADVQVGNGIEVPASQAATGWRGHAADVQVSYSLAAVLGQVQARAFPAVITIGGQVVANVTASQTLLIQSGSRSIKVAKGKRTIRVH